MVKKGMSEAVSPDADCGKHEWEEIVTVMRCKNCGRGTCFIKKGVV